MRALRNFGHENVYSDVTDISEKMAKQAKDIAN